MNITDAAFEPKNHTSVVRPYVLSHGTLECYNLRDSRTFYEEFLGLECVRHARPAMAVRCGLKFHIRLEEPRCPKCDYLLFMLQSDRCPECGTPVRGGAPNKEELATDEHG